MTRDRAVSAPSPLRELREGRGTGPAYYNEYDRDAAHVLRCLIADGLIAPGDVDDRSIKDVQPNDLDGYTQCHFFAGAGLWSVAARLAGWPDDRPLWTGSCPCQPFSAAGRGLGTDDPRHLWPDFFRLIRAKRPSVVMGEQVAGAPGYGWFDGVRADLAGEDFASRVIDIPVCAVDGPHIRQRLYWISVANGHDNSKAGGASEFSETARGNRAEPPYGADWHLRGGYDRRVAHANSAGPAAIGRDAGKVSSVQASQRRTEDDPALSRGSDATATDILGDAVSSRLEGQRRHGADRDEPGRVAALEARPASPPDGRNGSAWAGAGWLVCHDGKARRTEPGIRLLVDGMAGRVPAWRLAGNSISPILAAEVIGAFLDVERAAAMTETTPTLPASGHGEVAGVVEDRRLSLSFRATCGLLSKPI